MEIRTELLRGKDGRYVLCQTNPKCNMEELPDDPNLVVIPLSEEAGHTFIHLVAEQRYRMDPAIRTAGTAMQLSSAIVELLLLGILGGKLTEEEAEQAVDELRSLIVKLTPSPRQLSPNESAEKIRELMQQCGGMLPSALAELIGKGGSII